MDNTTRNRRMAGRLMVGAALVALPLTATISYAASDVPAPPAPPAPPAVSSFGLAPPAPPAPPEAPEPPLPPEPPLADQERIIVIDPDGEVSRADRQDRDLFIFEGRDETDKDVRLVIRDGKGASRWVQRFEHSGDGPLTDDQIEKILAGVRESLEEANRSLEDLPRVIEEAQKEAEAARLRSGAVRIEMKCDPDSDEPATKFKSDDGATIVRLCQARVMEHALKGLREARREIQTSREMGLRQQQYALREMDRVIDRWEDATK